MFKSARGKRIQFKPTPAQYVARFFPGLVFLDSGIGKFNNDKEKAQYLQGFASVGVPQLKKLDSQVFNKMISVGEMATGAALLAPFVPNRIAGAALTAFSSGFITLYLRAPGMRRERSLGPSENGLTLVKDSWILGLGLALMLTDSRLNETKATSKAKLLCK